MRLASFYLPGGVWTPFVDDSMGELTISFDLGGTGFGGSLRYPAALDFIRGGWDMGNFWLQRVRGGTTRTYTATVFPLLPWPETGLYILHGNFFDGSGPGGGFWIAQKYIVA